MLYAYRELSRIVRGIVSVGSRIVTIGLYIVRGIVRGIVNRSSFI
jgi:hypothetical protein